MDLSTRIHELRDKANSQRVAKPDDQDAALVFELADCLKQLCDRVDSLRDIDSAVVDD